jgi:hypothetical protein
MQGPPLDSAAEPLCLIQGRYPSGGDLGDSSLQLGNEDLLRAGVATDSEWIVGDSYKASNKSLPFQPCLGGSSRSEVPALPSDVRRTLKWIASDGFRLGARRRVLLGLFLCEQLL